jgi:hypothetical protein
VAPDVIAADFGRFGAVAGGQRELVENVWGLREAFALPWR